MPKRSFGDLKKKKGKPIQEKEPIKEEETEEEMVFEVQEKPKENKPKKEKTMVLETDEVSVAQNLTKPSKKKEERYPITIPDINANNTLLARVDKDEKVRILREINLLKFAVANVLEDGDYYGRIPTRSGVHKLQTIFNIDTEIMEEKYWKEGDEWVAKYKVRAIAPSGRYAEAIGLCEEKEKGLDRTMHETLATAQTRATNRAILDLVGFGAVSSEEIDDGIELEL